MAFVALDPEPASPALEEKLQEAFLRTHERGLQQIYERSGAGRWGLSLQQFATPVYHAINAEFGAARTARTGKKPTPKAVEAFLEELNAEDLALACACQHGNEEAWRHFVSHYRPLLLRAALALVGDEARAEEIADSLYADLYGLEDREGRRRSLLGYFHGRSRLATWLRAVIARKAADLYRERRRFEPLDRAPATTTGVAEDPPEPERARLVELLRRALGRAFATLEPRDRLRLAYYYVDGRTLTVIGRLLGEHESTVSRKIARSRKQVRSHAERFLRRNEGLSRQQIRLAYETAVDTDVIELGPDLREANPR